MSERQPSAGHVLLSETDRHIVLAVMHDREGPVRGGTASLAFIPLKEANVKRLAVTFMIPPTPPIGSSISIPLVLAETGVMYAGIKRGLNDDNYVAGQIKLMEYDESKDPWGKNRGVPSSIGYRVAHMGPGDPVYINHSRDRKGNIPYGVSLSTLDTNAKPIILGFTSGGVLWEKGRLGLSTGSKNIKNGTAMGYAVDTVSPSTIQAKTPIATGRPTESGLIFRGDDDRTVILAVTEKHNLSALGFVPIDEAIERGLRFHFKIPAPSKPKYRSKGGLLWSFPLELVDGQRIFLNKGPGWRIAQAKKGDDGDLVVIHYTKNKYGAGNGTVNGISLTVEDPTTKKLNLLGLDSMGRLAKETTQYPDLLPYPRSAMYFVDVWATLTRPEKKKLTPINNKDPATITDVDDDDDDTDTDVDGDIDIDIDDTDNEASQLYKDTPAPRDGTLLRDSSGKLRMEIVIIPICLGGIALGFGYWYLNVRTNGRASGTIASETETGLGPSEAVDAFRFHRRF
jgi:hypothetical protein